MTQDLSQKQTSQPKTSEECENAFDEWQVKCRLDSHALHYETWKAAYELREKEIQALEERNQRWVEALTKISEMSEVGSEESFARATQDDLMAEAANCFTYCKDIARAALSQNLPALEGETKAKEV